MDNASPPVNRCINKGINPYFTVSDMCTYMQGAKFKKNISRKVSAILFTVYLHYLIISDTITFNVLNI